jgi:hypothetical protein
MDFTGSVASAAFELVRAKDTRPYAIFIPLRSDQNNKGTESRQLIQVAIKFAPRSQRCYHNISCCLPGPLNPACVRASQMSMIRARRFKIWGLNPPVCYDAIIGGETSIPRIDMPECARPNVSSSGLPQFRLPEMATRPFRDGIAGPLSHHHLIGEARTDFLKWVCTSSPIIHYRLLSFSV